MNFVAHKGDTLNLENDEKFLVVDTIEYENEAYLLLMTAPEMLLKNVDVELKYSFAKEIVDKVNQELSIQEVTDVELIKKLTEKVKK